MKKTFYTIILIFILSVSLAQVGINTTMPNAQLDIKSSNQVTPANNDGILIPKIDAFPAINPTAAQNSMMVYLTATSLGKLPGFYYWHQQSLSWKRFNVDGEGNPKYYTVVGTTDISATTNSTPMAEMTQTFIPNSTIILVQFGAAGFNSTNACGQNPVYFTLLLDGLPVKTIQSSMEDINLVNRPIWDTTMIYPLTVTQGIPHTISINWFTSCGGTNLVLNNVLTPAPTGNYQAYRSLTITDPNGGGGIVGTVPVVTNDSWSTVGNLGTNPGTNFMGTIDDNDVVFKRKNIIAGKLSITNVAFGVNAALNTTGISNIAIGPSALISNVAGAGAVAIGSNAMLLTNSSNIAFPNHSVAIGFEAIRGYSSNNTGNNNTAIGYQALKTNYNATDNAAIGNETLINNYNGSNNVALGSSALHTQNFFNGGTAFDSDNVAIGYNSLFANNPTAVTNGIHNVGLGSYTIKDNTTGNDNTALGYNSLLANTTGSNNIVIGANSNVPTLNANNQLSIGNVIYGSNINNTSNTQGNVGISTVPNIKYGLYNYMLQQTANLDGQYSSYSYRTRNSQNDGISYGFGDTNAANTGYNFWGDVYTFGTVGYSYNDFTRTGGILGAVTNGTYWSSLGYKNSAGVNYGVYATAALATGAGRFSQPQSQAQHSIGGGFYGGLIGSWSKGSMIGNINSGSLFASYNSGDEYTNGKQIEIVATADSTTAAYTVTSTEVVVYKKGRITLTNGSARVNFDENYVNLLGDIPIVTATPMGQCNGIYIESVDKNGFIIKELNYGTSNITISWISVGDRIDASTASSAVLDINFDDNINEVMFNENKLNESAKAIWSEGNNIRFGSLPENLKERVKK